MSVLNIPVSGIIPAGSHVILEFEVETPNTIFPVGYNALGPADSSSWILCSSDMADNQCINSLFDFGIMADLWDVVASIYETRESPIKLIAGLSSGSIFPVGTTVNTYMLTDECGFSDTCNTATWNADAT